MSLESKQQELAALKSMAGSLENCYLMQQAILGDSDAKDTLQTKQDVIDAVQTEVTNLGG